MEAWGRWIVRHPLLIMVAYTVMTAVLGFHARQIRIENSIDSVLPAGDPRIAYYDEVRSTFGTDELAVVGVSARDLFIPQTLEKIAHLTDALAAIEGVERVLSITNAVDPATDLFDPAPRVSRLPTSEEDIEALKQKLASVPLYRQNLIAGDLQGAAINLFFEPMSDAEYRDGRISERILAVLDSEYGSFYYTGTAHLEHEAIRLMRHDVLRFTPLALGLMLVVLGLSFRTIRGMVLPVLAASIALTWTLGVMVLAGKALNLGTLVLPPLLIVIGSSFAIYFLARYYEEIAGGAQRQEVLIRTLRGVWIPLLASAVTAMIGFGTLGLSRITAVRELGTFAVIGVACAAITVLTFIPAALQLLGVERRPRATSAPPWISRAMAQLAGRAYRSRRSIVSVSVLVAGLALAGAPRIDVDADFVSYFEPGSQVRRDNEIINRQIVGSNPFYLVVEGNEPGAMQRWEALRLVKDLQAFVLTLPGVTSVVSIVDYLEILEAARRAGGDTIAMDRVDGVGTGEPAELWEDPARLTALLQGLDTAKPALRSVVTPDFRRVSILVRTNLSGSSRIEKILQQIRAHVAQHFPGGYEVHPTGRLVLLTGATSHIVSGQIDRLALTLAVIFAVMSAMFLSLEVGLLALLPNLLPVAIIFGAIGWLGIPLNMGTSLIATIALGLAFSSSIHYLARLDEELRGDGAQEAAASRALQAVGPPTLYTAVALFSGFLVFAFSSFVPIRDFGTLGALGMAAALGANLFLLPALVARTKVIGLWDLVALKLGENPAHTIPLLAGLNPGEARLVVLMGRIKRFQSGEVVMRQGDDGEEMYVILAGRIQVFAGAGESRRQLTELERGEVIGEMGLVRQHRRSADAVAADTVEVLAVDDGFLERIQQRYPRIASRVFLNLTRILSDRLQRMSERYVAEEQ